jgi:transcription antitermination factor NusG
MPILKREPDITPGLFDLEPALHPWRVAHVRSRQEKALARHCHDREIPFYLPLTANEIVTRPGANSQTSRRIRTSYNPLFPGYVFLRPSASQRVDALQSNVIVNLLEVTDQSILADELGQIHALQASGAILVPFPWLTTGDAVRIRDGAFKGYEGVIVKEKGEERLVVSISMIMRSVMVELGRESVAPGRVASRVSREVKEVNGFRF